jgi:hypothetical protein
VTHFLFLSRQVCTCRSPTVLHLDHRGGAPGEPALEVTQVAKGTLTFSSTFRRRQQLLLLQHPRRRRLSHPRGTTTQPTWREDLVFLNSRSHARSKEIENTLVALAAATSYCKTAFCLSFTSLTCRCVPPSPDCLPREVQFAQLSTSTNVLNSSVVAQGSNLLSTLTSVAVSVDDNADDVAALWDNASATTNDITALTSTTSSLSTR